MVDVPGVEEIAGRFNRLREQVLAAQATAGRPADSVQIELAAKYQAPERVLTALNAGASLLGHNIIQQLEASETALARVNAPIHRTHVIGHVQKNKAAKALRYAQCIETVDSFKLAARLDRLHGEQVAAGAEYGEDAAGAFTKLAETFDIMIQVNSSGAESQYGRSPESVVDFAGRVAELPNLRIIGLMTIGAHTDDVSRIARSFQIVRELRDELVRDGITSVTELSMGMTHDMDVAIAEGSTIIRVGTAVFGPRPSV